MPTYDYVCDACEHKFELFQSIMAEAEKKCPECGKRKLRRLIGPGAAIVFKGSGFYSTDYRSASYKKGAPADPNGSGAGKESSAKESSAGKETSSKDTAAGGDAHAKPAGGDGKKESKKQSSRRHG